MPFSAVSHSLLLLHEAPLADHGDVRAATLNWVSQRLRKGEVGFEGAHQGPCPGTSCPSSIRWSPLPCRTCTTISFEARIRSEVIFVEVQTILRCPSCTWCCTFLQVASYQCFTVRTDMGRGHVGLQVELSWAGNSGLNLDLNQTPFHVPSSLTLVVLRFSYQGSCPRS